MSAPLSTSASAGPAPVAAWPAGDNALPAPLLLSALLAYFALLLAVAWWAGRRADNEGFFVGNKSSHWLLVAFGMIGTSLSGVTFISVPGMVGSSQFSYLQIIAGQLIGYGVVAFVLLPLYYRFNVSSIYKVLAVRLGPSAQRTGASFFILSRTLGATARLYLVVRVLQDMVLERMGLPFWLSATVVLLMILLYTMDGGVKAIVWTDTLQTLGMLCGLVLCVALLLQALGLNLREGWHALSTSGMTQVVVTDPMSAGFWGKQVLAGMAIAVAMTGLDQEMMQKNISVRRLIDAQKNMLLMAGLTAGVVLLFLFLGGLLSLFAQQHGLTAQGDRLFPAVVLEYFPAWVQMLFLVALTSALFPSADGAITALTSSTCLDLLGLMQRKDLNEAAKARLRKRVHLGYAALFLLLTLALRWLDNASMVTLILKIAAYTYGPLLGLFAFALVARGPLDPRRAAWAVPAVALAAPALCGLIEAQQSALLGSYRFGLEILLLNAALTWAGLWAVARIRPRAPL